MEKKTIVLATYGATRGHAHSDCMEALRCQLGLQYFDTKGHSQIDMARSLLASHALAHGADVVVFIDHDILFDPMDVIAIADVAREVRGVVGAPYSMRQLGGAVVGGLTPTEGEPVVFYEGGGLYDASGTVGMGFTAIHREAFERFHELPEYAEVNSGDGLSRPYFQKRIIDGYWHKEDDSFCRMCRKLGIPTKIDTRIRVLHVGEHAFRIEDCRVRVTQENTLKLGIRRA